MTSQGTAHGRFTRALQQRNLFAAEVALREMRNPLLVALDYLVLLVEVKPESSRSPRCASTAGFRTVLGVPAAPRPQLGGSWGLTERNAIGRPGCLHRQCVSHLLEKR